ncbi:D-alanyl-D-alanine carboxypeptidase family protein [bacterium]|nr:D-alanyl-D-alanine carboxypeptidase family protein [bacterium]
MKEAAQREGISLFIASGYRSYRKQQQLYQNYVNRDGKKSADRYSARP